MIRCLTAALLCACVFLSGCAGAGPEPGAVATGASGPADVRLYVFDCGSLHFDDITSFGLANDDTPVRDLFVPCYLVRHDDKLLLWDTGLPLAAAGAPRSEPEPGMQMVYARSIVDQLADMGIAASDIDLLALSHFHFDHAGGADAFGAAALLIQRSEYEAAFVHPEDFPVFMPALYSGLADSPRVLLDGDLDVFGDGSVRILAAPGHTPGHQVLLVNLARTGPVLLGGDLYHFRATRSLRAVPEFNTSREETLASMDRVEDVLRQTGATLWIEHDQTLADTLRKAPAYYD